MSPWASSPFFSFARGYGGHTNTWDRQNRLVSCVYNGTTSTFPYGADGLRRSATVSGVTTYYVYDGQTLIREMMKNAQNALYNTATYLTGPRGPEYRRDDTATELDSQGRTVSKTRWYVYDGLGSVVGEMDPNGTLTSSPKYDVYGLVRSNSGTASSKMGFVGGLGHLSEANTGLIYMRARYYDPTQGRFASEDSRANGTNWYVYCSNNPINRIDRSGEADTATTNDVDWWISALQGMAMTLIGVGTSRLISGIAQYNLGDRIMTAGLAAFLDGAGLGLIGALIGQGIKAAGASEISGGLSTLALGLTLLAVSYECKLDEEMIADDREQFGGVPWDPGKL